MPWSRADAQSTFWLDTADWRDRPLSAIKYLDRLLDTFRRLSAGASIDICLEQDGRSLVKGALADQPTLRRYARAVCALLSYTQLAARLDRQLHAGLRFDPAVQFSAEEHRDLSDAVHTFDADPSERVFDVRSEIVVELEVTPKAEAMIGVEPQEGQFIMREETPRTLSIFGQTVQLPLREFVAEHARLRLHRPVPTGTARVQLNITPLEGSSSYYRYVEHPLPSAS